ncbi:phospho-acceptor domain-containing protein [Bacillus oleivorans]|uniref:histidine kinase n=1 Tax=Bacillus oleivorans TaxID=1448271 RepID=A0A285CTA3_9BACI|nr:sensor histidine kinase [Bacillus oleivorans]SNX70781.1 phospho-acceptor domain-containing protein [Bacillus oleivorans]
MEPVFIFIIVILLWIVLVQFNSKRKLKKDLFDIQAKLAEIIDQETSEKLLLQTDYTVIQQFLIQINRLLDYNQKIIADYAKTKLELQKMLANMSHDLKTPLTVILGYVEKLKIDETMSEEERKETVANLYRKTTSVISLINQFFDLVRLESGDSILPLDRVHINEVCRKNVLDFYGLLQAKKLQVEVEIPEEPLYILGNEQALNRVLSNLISNAISYGNDGHVIGITLRESGNNIAVEVWDKGRGISEIDQERVFERLYTLDDARNQAFQGSGLGLSITKRLVEAMRGTIRAESKPYIKTVFTCKFRKISY